MSDYEDIIADLESRHQPEHELEEVEPVPTHSSRMIPETPNDMHAL